ncbi:uncharacterized protein LOC127265246 isoform X3 [Andrographis paniculata]|uniref:uncharacterized protein LOC127265246 isoform X1 n=1 Tax=Andrographis paniculata TaxID=175694 RepID=UPI0021E8CAF2|nr:uncharacterized protein LOC127265246 isoform X1 [Andrographis paniculata]XP_051150931.1 uncharacterized protein LOC127265246 isoform X2 [Andrographis paniculata]XP_051150932.1 uncharacterized protein LOC127265246 isoform X3 [Andrographis paniculata]
MPTILFHSFMGVILNPYLQSGWQLLIMDLNIKATRTVVICNSVQHHCNSIQRYYWKRLQHINGFKGKSFSISVDSNFKIQIECLPSSGTLIYSVARSLPHRPVRALSPRTRHSPPS